jgi:hypothetical protein
MLFTLVIRPRTPFGTDGFGHKMMCAKCRRGRHIDVRPDQTLRAAIAYNMLAVA